MEIVRYNKSHLAKLTFLSDKMKMYYSQIKNVILSYDKVKNSISWEGERFYVGRNTLIRFVARGKSINIYFALTPQTLDSKYGVVDVSEVKKYADLPTMLKMKGPRSFGYAKELVEELMQAEEIEYNLECEESYGLELKSRSIEKLLEEGLVKPVYGTKSAKASSVEDEDDDDDEEEEEEVTEIVPKLSYSYSGLKKEQVARSLRTIINLASLEANFKDGEEVNLDTLKDKGIIDVNMMYVKLLADGKLSKKLNIALNDYSAQAIAKLESLL